ncbi:hypothetical protein ACNFU2_06610 [Chryseobacterium sp. PTM-20240506]|uniref:hypothetical protein n=1 Tax=Chryseobacterium sp. PTM-20240506 TaxID=3400631 RepID=UPI003AAE16A4
MDNTIKTELESLVGKKIYYQKQNVTIQKYKEIAGNICIVTDSRTFQFYPDEIRDKFLNMISEEKDEGSYPPGSDLERKTFAVIPKENSSIKDALMEALKKVKEDPTFLQQAKAICDITNTMVNVQKTEIEIIKLQKEV